MRVGSRNLSLGYLSHDLNSKRIVERGMNFGRVEGESSPAAAVLPAFSCRLSSLPLSLSLGDLEGPDTLAIFMQCISAFSPQNGATLSRPSRTRSCELPRLDVRVVQSCESLRTARQGNILCWLSLRPCKGLKSIIVKLCDYRLEQNTPKYFATFFAE